MHYVFLSFGSLHTGKALGACVVRVRDPQSANDEAERLGLMPDECNRAHGYVLDEASFKKQGLSLNRFYSSEELKRLGFSK